MTKVLLTGDMLGLDARHAQITSLLIYHARVCAVVIQHPGHGRVVALNGTGPLEILLASKATHAWSPSRTPASSFTVSCQRVTSCEFPVAFWANMWFFSRM